MELTREQVKSKGTLGNALIEAILDFEHKPTLDIEPDYWEEVVNFLLDHEIPKVLIPSYYWYSHVVYGLSRQWCKEHIRCYKAGMVFMEIGDFEELIQKKIDIGIGMSILQYTPVKQLPGVNSVMVVAHEALR